MHPLPPGSWFSIQNTPAYAFVCGFCGNRIASDKGWPFHFGTPPQPGIHIHVCPHCRRPTFFEDRLQVPGVPFGDRVQHVPPEVGALYDEARRFTADNAFTAAVLATRKLLMHIAVDQGAKPGDTFMAYIEYLAASGFVPPHGKGWVDHIRKKGNEANHEIVLMGQADAVDLINFTEMLLKFIYEFPKRVPVLPAAPTSTTGS